LGDSMIPELEKLKPYLQRDQYDPYKLFFDALRLLPDRTESYRYNRELRAATLNAARRTGDVRFVELNKLTYLYSARDVFEDYMIYVEWNREPEKRFYLPRRKVLRPVVQDMQRLVDGELELLAVSLPPGTGKTTLKIFLLSWLAGKDPDKPNLDSGHSGMMTSSTYDGVLAIMQDKAEYLWSDVFPEVKSVITNAKELTIDLNKKHRFSTLTFRAIGATLTGATRCEGILSADDLVSGIEEAMSKDRLDKKWEAYANDLKSRKKLGARELHISTRWSCHDVIGRLERQFEGDPKAKFIVIPALDSQGESNFNYDYGVGFDKAFFASMAESLDDASFRALYMNEPIEREGILYHPDDLRRYFELPDHEPDAIIGICDPKEKGTDYAFLPVAYVYGQDYYLDDCLCDNGALETVDVRMVDILVTKKVKMVRFESNSAGFRTAEKIQKGVKERGGITHITTIRTKSNKETRIIVNSPWVKEHVLFRDASAYPNADYKRMMNLLCSWTMSGKNKNDDVPDGMAMLAEFAQTMGGAKVEVAQRPW
jgi:predicted phage terminase large subunit-like protein